MGWQDLLEDTSARLVAPWLGERRVHREGRTWRVIGRPPREYGWYEWETEGRTAKLVGPAEADPDYTSGPWDRRRERGYLVGDRAVLEGAGAGADVEKFLEHTIPVFLVEPGLDRFAFVEIGFAAHFQPLYKQELFPQGPEDEVRRAFVDRKESVNHIAGVNPALDLAFRFATRQRQLTEERRAELERIREEERKREEAMRNMGTGLGRRTLAATDFDSAARAALAVGGAELLDVRQGRSRNEMVVQYRFGNRRLECVADRATLRIIDSGVCLTDQAGEKGDTYFTLESLPAVIQQAIREDRLHVYRHVDGDVDHDWEDY
jgi:hypothetical protein